jgi:hypothetical protein
MDKVDPAPSPSPALVRPSVAVSAARLISTITGAWLFHDVAHIRDDGFRKARSKFDLQSLLFADYARARRFLLDRDRQ